MQRNVAPAATADRAARDHPGGGRAPTGRAAAVRGGDKTEEAHRHHQELTDGQRPAAAVVVARRRHRGEGWAPSRSTPTRSGTRP